MRKPTKILLTSFLGVFVVASMASAGVMVSVNGESNGVLLWGFDGPKRLGRLAKVAASGGSIKTARARGIFTKPQVIIANEVISRGTKGDPLLTHVRAGSLFYGKAKIVANKKGARIDNFVFNYKVNGLLKCKTPDPTIPSDYSKAFMETEVVFDNVDKFSGQAAQDGTGPFSASGKLSGKFTKISKYQRRINKLFPISLGRVRDGQIFTVLFSGSTGVSYGPDVPIDYCAADFMKTSTYSAKDGQGATMKFIKARTIETFFDPDPFTIYAPSTELSVFLEAERALLEKIDMSTVRLYERIGDNGSITPSSMNDIGDQDNDGKPDRALIFSGTDAAALLQLALYGYVTQETLFVIGDTTDDQPFVASGVLRIQ